MTKLKLIHDKFDKHSYSEAFNINGAHASRNNKESVLARCACGDWTWEGNPLDTRVLWYVDGLFAKTYPAAHAKHIVEIRACALASFNKYVAPYLGRKRATEFPVIALCKHEGVQSSRGLAPICPHCNRPVFWKDTNPYTMKMLLSKTFDTGFIDEPWAALMKRSDAQVIVNYFAARIALNEFAADREQEKNQAGIKATTKGGV